MEAQQYIASLIEKASVAQKKIENYTQEQVDALVRNIAKVIYDNAEMLAKLAVDETRMGVYEHKVLKNMGKPRVIWNEMKGKKSVGIIKVDEENGIVEVAKPIGVIGAITPTTNPIVTPMCNAMFAIKGRNSIIVCPHPRAEKCSGKAVELMNAEIKKLGGPDDLIQIVAEPTNEKGGLIMSMTDVCIATGGMGVVKAAYSSGKPAYGVGAGNVQTIIDKDINIPEAVKMIITGRAFDNGIICSGEQTAITPVEIYAEVMAEFQNQGAYYTEDAAEIDALRAAIFPNGIMNKDLVGQSPIDVAKVAGITVPENTTVIVIKAPTFGAADLLSKEKMCPVITAYEYKTWEEAVDIAEANLEFEGKGHSACIHSNTKANIEYAAERLPVSRFVINQVCSTSNGGSLTNGLSATTTLGCGSWGNNSISENLSWKHLFNVSRIAYVKPNAVIPTDDQIWG